MVTHIKARQDLTKVVGNVLMIEEKRIRLLGLTKTTFEIFFPNSCSTDLF